MIISQQRIVNLLSFVFGVVEECVEAGCEVEIFSVNFQVLIFLEMVESFSGDHEGSLLLCLNPKLAGVVLLVVGEEPRVEADGCLHSVVSNSSTERRSAAKGMATDHKVCKVKHGFAKPVAERLYQEASAAYLVDQDHYFFIASEDLLVSNLVVGQAEVSVEIYTLSCCLEFPFASISFTSLPVVNSHEWSLWLSAITRKP